MIGLERKGGENSLLLLETKSLQCREIPPELLEHIFSYLENTDLASTVIVSKFWKTATVETVKKREFFLIKETLEFFSKTLEFDANCFVGAVMKGNPSSKILQAVDLLEVRRFILEIRRETLNILKNLTDECLNLLEKSSEGVTFPVLFKNIFNSAKQWKKTEAAIARFG